MIEKIFRVDATVLNLRVQPSTASGIVTRLRGGQAVARLDDFDHDGWWFVFADTPGDGLYVGYVFSDYLTPVNFAGTAPPEVRQPLPPAEDEADSPEREPEGRTAPDGDGTALPVPAEPPVPLAWDSGWNPSIIQRRIHESPNQGARRGGASVERIVIHITGTNSLDVVRDRFLNPRAQSSAHYLIEPNGALHQFVAEDRRAWHSGINRTIRGIYDRNDGSWRRYKRYFGWAKTQGWYPADSVYLDENLNLLGSNELNRARLVMPAGGGEWPDYSYFDAAWGRAPLPVGYGEGTRDPNNDSIGIEVLSMGSKRSDPSVYTPEMYAALSGLVADICVRHGITPSRETVCGHEDVNPVERWGWDPNRGFEWDRILGGGLWG